MVKNQNRMRFILVLIALCILAVFFVRSVSNRLPKNFPAEGYGVFDGCKPAVSDCIHHLDQLAKGRFTVVLNYAGLQGTSDQIRAYAAHAKALGIKIIWSMK